MIKGVVYDRKFFCERGETMSEHEWLDIFGDNLAEMMYEQGYSQKDLADETGLSEASISNYINKRRMPTIKAIVNIAYALDIDFNELIDFGERVY